MPRENRNPQLEYLGLNTQAVRMLNDRCDRIEDDVEAIRGELKEHKEREPAIVLAGNRAVRRLFYTAIIGAASVVGAWIRRWVFQSGK